MGDNLISFRWWIGSLFPDIFTTTPTKSMLWPSCFCFTPWQFNSLPWNIEYIYIYLCFVGKSSNWTGQFPLIFLYIYTYIYNYIYIDSPVFPYFFKIDFPIFPAVSISLKHQLPTGHQWRLCCMATRDLWRDRTGPLQCQLCWAWSTLEMWDDHQQYLW